MLLEERLLTRETPNGAVKQWVQVKLPPRYTPLKSFPVLYVLDGDSYRVQGKLISAIDQFRETHSDKPEWITIFVPVDMEERDLLYRPGTNAHAKFLQWFVQELIPFVDHHYGTWTIGSGRGLIGHSLSGVCALSIAKQYPHAVSSICAQSPYLPDDFIQEWEDCFTENKNLVPLHIYLSVGTDETKYTMHSGEVFDFLTSARKFCPLVTTQVLSLIYQEHGGGHTWGSWQSDLPDLLKALSNQLQNV